MTKSNSALQAQHLQRALNYPYDRPDYSYKLHHSEAQPLDADFLVDGRLPVIACGSNAAPEQLIRKFQELDADPIFVTRIKLSNFVCSYSAHITAYGSIPATLAYQEKSITQCHLTWLTEAQLDHMHKTEALGINYRFSKLKNLQLDCEIKGAISEAYAYVGLHGNLTADNIPIVISAIEASSPAPLPHMDQYSMQNRIRQAMAPEKSLQEFIKDNIIQSDLRRDRTKILRQNAARFTYTDETVILPEE